jgi:RND family efflux transporter MFP subunit
VYADLDENALLRFNAASQSGKLAKNGDGRLPVELQLADEPGFSRQGFVESLDNRLDPQSGSIVLRATFPNPDGRLVPGLFARIRFPASAKAPALLIEDAAIGTDQAQKFVLTLTSSNTAAYRPVKLGPLVEGKRVVREGLQAGEKVVLNLVAARVRPGMPVVPQEGTPTNNGSKVAQR